MRRTLVELLHQYKASEVEAIPLHGSREQTRLNAEEVTFKPSLNEKCDESHTTFPRPLGRTLALNESTYNQIERTGQIAIYEGPRTGMFEVIVIQTKPTGVCPSGAVVPWREVYPVAEKWGTYGWTFTSGSHGEPLAAAREKVMAMGRR